MVIDLGGDNPSVRSVFTGNRAASAGCRERGSKPVNKPEPGPAPGIVIQLHTGWALLPFLALAGYGQAPCSSDRMSSKARNMPVCRVAVSLGVSGASA